MTALGIHLNGLETKIVLIQNLCAISGGAGTVALETHLSTRC